jgi:antitoxin HicB
VPVPVLIEAKLCVYEAMRTANMGRADLARRLRWHRPQVDRLLNLHHASKLDQIEAAAEVLGKRLTLAVHDVEAAEPRRAIPPKPRKAGRRKKRE